MNPSEILHKFLRQKRYKSMAVPKLFFLCPVRLHMQKVHNLSMCIMYTCAVCPYLLFLDAPLHNGGGPTEDGRTDGRGPNDD